MKSYFQMTRKQSVGVTTLLVLIFLASLFNMLMPLFFSSSKETSLSPEVLAAFNSLEIDSTNSYEQQEYKPSALTPFVFNPNTLDSAGFVRLGLREKLVKTLMNYKRKGGKFYNKESLKRIYGLHDEEYARLEPYINIPNEHTSYANNTQKPQVIVELNSADTGQLIKLRMIGSKLAQNIVNYRNQLGGFARVEQIKEVWGISDETYNLIKDDLRVDPSRIKKLNLNVATYAELNEHPYLKGELAKAITDYRRANDYKLQSLSELKKIELISEDLFRRIAPYLVVQ